MFIHKIFKDGEEVSVIDNYNTEAINLFTTYRHSHVVSMSSRDLATHFKRATARDSTREWSMWNGVRERSHPGNAQDPEVVAMRNTLTDVTSTITTITTTMKSVRVQIQIRYILCKYLHEHYHSLTSPGAGCSVRITLSQLSKRRGSKANFNYHRC